MNSQPEAERLVSLLAATPERIAAMARGVDDASLAVRTATEPWSANDVLAHLRACQDVREKLVHEMLSRDSPAIRYVSPRTYIRKTNYPDLPFHESLASFEQGRAAFVERLQALNPQEWLRSADLKGRRRETVLDCANFLVAHEAVHINQMRALIGHPD